MKNKKQSLTLCKHCDHFVDANLVPDDDVAETHEKTIMTKDGQTLCRYVHLEDGEQEFDHDAEPGETRDDWDTHRPDLFQRHPDGAIGPNSIFHDFRGKTPPLGYFIRGETGSEDRIGPDIGPFPEYIQMRYNELTVGPNGGSIGAYCQGEGWSFYKPFGDEQTFYSDIIIYAEPLKQGQKFIVVDG